LEENHSIFSFARIIGLVGTFASAIGIGTELNPRITNWNYFIIIISLIFSSSLIRAASTFFLSLRQEIPLRSKIWCACVNSIKGTVILYFFGYTTMRENKLISSTTHDYLLAIAFSYLILGLPLIQVFMKGKETKNNETVNKSKKNNVSVIEENKNEMKDKTIQMSRLDFNNSMNNNSGQEKGITLNIDNQFKLPEYLPELCFECDTESKK